MKLWRRKQWQNPPFKNQMVGQVGQQNPREHFAIFQQTLYQIYQSQNFHHLLLHTKFLPPKLHQKVAGLMDTLLY